MIRHLLFQSQFSGPRKTAGNGGDRPPGRLATVRVCTSPVSRNIPWKVYRIGYINLDGDLVIPKSVTDYFLTGRPAPVQETSAPGDREYQVTATASFAHGRKFTHALTNRYFKQTFIGVGVKLLYGLSYSKYSLYSQEFTRKEQSTIYQTQIHSVRSRGGVGFALDAGFTGEWSQKLTLGISVNNLVGLLHWPARNTSRKTYRYRLNAYALNLEKN